MFVNITGDIQLEEDVGNLKYTPVHLLNTIKVKGKMTAYTMTTGPARVSPRPPCEISDEAPAVAAQTVQALRVAFEALKG